MLSEVIASLCKLKRTPLRPDGCHLLASVTWPGFQAPYSLHQASMCNATCPTVLFDPEDNPPSRQQCNRISTKPLLPCTKKFVIKSYSLSLHGAYTKHNV